MAESRITAGLKIKNAASKFLSESLPFFSQSENTVYPHRISQIIAGVLRIIFENYHNDTVYEKLPLFYENWDNATSELLFKCDNEVQNICKELNNFDLSFVKSLKNHYESYTVQELTNKISNIEGFKGLKTPSIRVEVQNKTVICLALNSFSSFILVLFGK